MTLGAGQPTLRKPLRLWPGVIAAALMLALWFVLPLIVTEGAGAIAFLGGVACGAIILIWWLFFSRAPWGERLGALLLLVAVFFAGSRIIHESIAGAAMGMMYPILSIPLAAFCLVLWAVVTRRMPATPRRVWLVVIAVLGAGFMTAIRTGGLTSGGRSDFHWRWTETPEERMLAAQRGAKGAGTAPVSGSEAEWPGFRGPQRDGIVHGSSIATDWKQSPPSPIWRRPVGPGWSSFSVSGDVIFTQEQRGEEEVVSCYSRSTGEPVWTHGDPVRFYESNAGPGPRSTPTLANGRVYTFGATGLVNALDARDGSVIWSRDAAADTKRKVPHWGFASSPLVMNDLVVVAASGGIAAYDIASGEPRWLGPEGGWGYSSPHSLTIDGVPQIVHLNGAGALGLSPADGSILWKHEWKGDGIVQPALSPDGDVLVGSGSGLSGEVGLRSLKVARGASGWSAEERWTTIGLKPYFNDYVIHKGHAFGFDGSMLSCVDLKDGQRRWKGGRYGQGQLILLADQDLLLVLSESGELALVSAAPDNYTELARVPALEGKTWNHPVLAGDTLLVRNDHEMAAFRLSSARPY